VNCSDVEWSDVIYVKWFCFEVQWSEVMWSVVMWSELTWFMWSDFVLKFSEVQWSYVKCSNVEWTDVIYVKWFCLKFSEVKWVTVKFLGTKVPCTLAWPYTDITGLYCDYFVWCVSCTVVVLTCFVKCVWMYVKVFRQLCWCFGKMFTCIYCFLYGFYSVFLLFRLCIFILHCFVCTSVRTTATVWQLNCSQ